MTSTLQKLLRSQSQSASKIFTHLRRPQPPLPPFVAAQMPQITDLIDATPSPNHLKTEYLKLNDSFCTRVYPSFSFGFFLNTVSPTPFIRSEPDGEATADDSRVIRADSVKKKRKRKMNKHKLRKLRKRLRRKT